MALSTAATAFSFEDPFGNEADVAASVPAGVRVLRDQAYGSDPKQRFDVYLPAAPRHAPVMLMVHGGGWRWGDKAMARVVDNKMAHWVGAGFVFVSINTRLLPDAAPLAQADDAARAIARVQAEAAGWGADASRLVLVGHSAGAHLAALLSADPQRVVAAGGKSWLGSVLLDSAALDLPTIMQARHFRLYDKAFGSDPATWRAASPLQQLSPTALPMLAVCSTRRDDSCGQAEAFARAAGALGRRVEVLPQPRTHREINEQLGLPGDYTAAVEAFMASLGVR